MKLFLKVPCFVKGQVRNRSQGSLFGGHLGATAAVLAAAGTAPWVRGLDHASVRSPAVTCASRAPSPAPPRGTKLSSWWTSQTFRRSVWPRLRVPSPTSGFRRRRCGDARPAGWGWEPGTFTGGRVASADSSRPGSATPVPPSRRTAPPVGRRLTPSHGWGGGCGQVPESVLTMALPAPRP